MLQQQISQLPGVSQVQIFGIQRFAVRIHVDPDAVAARGLTLDDVKNAVSAANSNTPVGEMRGDKQRITLETDGQLLHAADYSNIVIAVHNGQPIRLRDVAVAVDGIENDQNAAWFGTTRSIQVAIYRQSDANTIDVVDQVKDHLAAYQAQLPPSVKLKVLLDRSVPIRNAVADVEKTLGIAIVLVIIVIFLFLKRLSATLIPALALPISLVGTFAAMHVLGYSIDNISLLALTLSVGFVVDDAIVMLENIVRHIEEGEKPFAAALKGSREIGFTILSITMSLVAVFIPVFFMGGIVGRVFREFAGTISIAILVSGLVSLTLTPMVCARVLRPERHGAEASWFERGVDAVFGAMQNAYRVTLRLALKARFVMLLVTFATLALSVKLYLDVPKGFFPLEDTGFIRGISEAAADTSFQAMAARQQALADVIRKDPAVDYYISVIGFTTINQGFFFIALKPRDERDSVFQVMARLRQASASVPGITFVAQPVQNLNLTGGRPSKALYQYIVTGPDLKELFELAPTLLEKLRKIPILRDVDIDLQLRNPQRTIKIDRDRAGILGVTADQIRNALYNAFGTRQISTIYTPSNDYQVIIQAKGDFQSDPNALSRVYVTSTSGQNVPLSAVATIVPTVGPLTVNRQSQLPAVAFSFNLGEGIALGQAIAAIRAAERDINMPATVSTVFTGSAQLFQEALAGQGLLLLAAVVVIYMVLGILYESFIHPITILSGLPSAGLGAVLSLAALRPRPFRHRHHRRAHADRHREEERDHDDRCRDHAAPARHSGRRRDPGSLHAALPPDHDDDLRGALRRHADRGRRGRGLGAAPAARHRRGRRARGLAIAHALHHARDLCVSRQDRAMDRRAPKKSACARRKPNCRTRRPCRRPRRSPQRRNRGTDATSDQARELAKAVKPLRSCPRRRASRCSWGSCEAKGPDSRFSLE